MKMSRFVLLVGILALVVGLAHAMHDSQAEQVAGLEPATSYFAQTPFDNLDRPSCSPLSEASMKTGIFPFPDLCAECLDRCHPQHYSCILACLNGPCI